MKNHFTHCVKHHGLGEDHIVSRHRDELHAIERCKLYNEGKYSGMYYVVPLDMEPNCEVVG